MSNTRYRNILAVFTLLAFVLSCSNQATPTVLPTPSSTSIPTSAPTSAAVLAPTETQVPTLPVDTPTATITIAAAALVNGQPIPLDEYETQVSLAMATLSQQQSFDQNTEEGRAALVQLRRQVLDWMIDQVLIDQAAAREGISIPEDKVEAEMTRLIGDDTAKFEEWLKANKLTRESFKAQLRRELLGAALQEHVVGSLPPVVEQVHARHILVMSEAEAMDILIKLRAGEDFAALAKQYSQDRGSRDMGGDLGFFPRGVMPAEIEAVAFALAPGQTSGIVKTNFGYHIIQVVEKDPSRKVSDEMLAAWRQRTFMQWLELQRASATIEYLIPLE